ncbi:TIGR02611 family protein [Modestobacter sp. I12A-02628]|uniref:TIGR02611 family protein n=1 Tax=Goekera deserti TaxID=2497753 RepID=A0A7K3WBI0_9ACTN|nr:TIGR02611 family protein [Goekera deserti]NDI47538.1 TIGR02611 family protein [Goekera deserti]NEL53349.1 TIGR02611 family protein [Goekera deserti]
MAGTVVVGLGLLLIPLPGPGWFIVFGGLFVWATEFTWAERLLAFARAKVGAWSEWLGRQPRWVQGLVGLATLAFVYGVVVVTLHVAGVPGWVPGWVPLWR